MAKSAKLSVLGGLVVGGAALGLYLGSSAISEINPAYYSTPLSRSAFHADLVPNRSDRSDAQPVIETAVADIGLGSDCVGCSTRPEEYLPGGSDHSVGDLGGAFTGSAPTHTADLIIAKAEEHALKALSLAEMDDITRYSEYRVSQDEEEPEPAETSGTAAETDREGAAGPGF